MKRFKDLALFIIAIAFLVVFIGFLIYTSLYTMFTVSDIRVKLLGSWVLVNTVSGVVDGIMSSFKEED